MGFFTWRREVTELLTAIKDNQINLSKEVSQMATAQQVADAVTAVKASIDAGVAKINDYKTNGVNPADLDPIVANLEAAKTELDAAVQ